MLVIVMNISTFQVPAPGGPEPGAREQVHLDRGEVAPRAGAQIGRRASPSPLHWPNRAPMHGRGSLSGRARPSAWWSPAGPCRRPGQPQGSRVRSRPKGPTAPSRGPRPPSRVPFSSRPPHRPHLGRVPRRPLAVRCSASLATVSAARPLQIHSHPQRGAGSGKPHRRVAHARPRPRPHPRPRGAGQWEWSPKGRGLTAGGASRQVGPQNFASG